MILRPDFENTQLAALGIVGSGFFINSNTFVTSYHLVNERSFTTEKNYNNSSLYLINPVQQSLVIQNSDIDKYLIESNVSYIKTKDDYEYFEIESDVREGMQVFNIGYPSELIARLVNLEPDKITIDKPMEQKGKVTQIISTMSVSANDINIKEKESLILDYSTSSGFGGGPLLSLNNKVVGIMSFVLPEIVSPVKSAVAISAKEFY